MFMKEVILSLPRLHLLDQKYSKNSNVAQVFTTLIWALNLVAGFTREYTEYMTYSTRVFLCHLMSYI